MTAAGQLSAPLPMDPQPMHEAGPGTHQDGAGREFGRERSGLCIPGRRKFASEPVAAGKGFAAAGGEFSPRSAREAGLSNARGWRKTGFGLLDEAVYASSAFSGPLQGLFILCPDLLV
jgi:hypothetical protein